MEVIQIWSKYSNKLYSPPWICKITKWFMPSDYPEVEWGKFVGQESIGGYVVIDAEEGDIIKTGQKNKSTGFSNTRWYKVVEEKETPDGNHIVAINGKIESWELYSSKNISKNINSIKEKNEIYEKSFDPFPKFKQTIIKNIDSSKVFISDINKPISKQEISQIGSNLELEMKICLKDFINNFGSLKDIDDYNLMLPIYNKAKAILEKANQKKYLMRSIEI